MCKKCTWPLKGICYIIDANLDILNMSKMWVKLNYIVCVHGRSFYIIINCIL